MEDRDAEAIRRVLAGEHHCFRELVERHQRTVYRVLYRLVGRAADAEDLTQQSFVEAYAHLQRYDPKRSFSTWLMRIAVNNGKDYLKSHKRRETSLGFDVAGRSAMHSGRVVGPEAAAELRQRAALVEAALQQLSPKYRVPVVLKDVEGLSYAQMKEMLELPITTLKIRVVRGRAQLQQLLSEAIEGDRDE